LEKIISPEERIRRAEEIYYRRKSTNSSGIRVSGDSVNVKKGRFSLFKKMSLQLAICAVIYIIFYLVKNTNYIFSDDVLAKTKELLSYDINFEQIYSSVTQFLENNLARLNEQETVAVDEENTEINNINENIEQDNKVEENEQTGGIGGAEVNEIRNSDKEVDNKKTQMELDAEYVKANYSLKIPTKGVVTSRYGAREKTEIISANHQGIDIGADTGTAIYAAMEGTVTCVSSEGDYRKACRDNKWNYYDKICTL